MTKDDKAKVANQPDCQRILIKHQVANGGKWWQYYCLTGLTLVQGLLPTSYKVLNVSDRNRRRSVRSVEQAT